VGRDGAPRGRGGVALGRVERGGQEGGDGSPRTTRRVRGDTAALLRSAIAQPPSTDDKFAYQGRQLMKHLRNIEAGLTGQPPLGILFFLLVFAPGNALLCPIGNRRLPNGSKITKYDPRDLDRH